VPATCTGNGSIREKSPTLEEPSKNIYANDLAIGFKKIFLKIRFLGIVYEKKIMEAALTASMRRCSQAFFRTTIPQNLVFPERFFCNGNRLDTD